MADRTCNRCGGSEFYANGKCGPCHRQRERLRRRAAGIQARPPYSVDGLRTCPGCGEVKPVERFTADSSKPAGRSSHCSACMERKPHRKAYRREYARARYAADPEYRERKLEIYRRSYRKRRAAAQA